jgi:hypothetical protein
MIKCEILWKGNPISVVKTFGKATCVLCNRERLEIIKISRSTPDIYQLLLGDTRRVPPQTKVP